MFQLSLTRSLVSMVIKNNPRSRNACSLVSDKRHKDTRESNNDRIASSTRLGTVEPDQKATTSHQTVPFPLPPTEEIKIYMDNYFGIFNTGMSLFDPLEFQTYFGKSYA